MRIRVSGKNDAAAELKGLLRHEGYLVTETHPTHSLLLEEESELADCFVVDGIDCPLEKRVSEHIHQLTGKNFLFDRVGPVRNDRELRIVFRPEDAHAVALGVFRGLLDVLQPRPRPTWWRKIWKF
jgi:hypothetical protein